MKRRIRLFIVVWLLVLTGTAGAQYDPGETMEAAARDLDRTDLVIERAKEVVVESGSERAKNLLEAAIRLQRQARSEMRSFDFDNYGQIAGQRLGKYTMSARKKAQRAIAVTRQADENENHVRRRLEMTDELIRRIEENTDSATPENILLVLETAINKQQRARELFRNRRLKMALQLTMQTRKSLERMAEQISGHLKTNRHQNSLQERYYTLLDRIEVSEVAHRAEVKNRLQRAEEFRLQAEKYAAENRYSRAEKAMQEAVNLLSRITERFKTPERIKNSLESMTRRMEEIRSRVGSSRNQQSARWYGSASEHLEKASAFYLAGKFEEAAVQLQAARQMLSRAKKSLED
ncbi:MAG: hypothetical protein GY841_09600 [FCB group bacterium]|nr:hypothetical protein [FCB group bacterium]